jgi:predicted Zn-dependent protease
VAAILAHEIGHIVNRHGIKSIEQARRTAAVTGVFVDAADNIGIMPLAELTDKFAGSINDITTKLVVNGYSREFEKQADAAAVDILIRVGYNPEALIELLEALDKNYTPGGLDFAKTHPDPKKRIKAIEKKLKGTHYTNTSSPAQREARFRAFYNELR